MPCSPENTTINIPANPSIQIPGFPTLPISPIQLPISGVTLPNIGSVLDLINQFTAIIPGGSLKPGLDDTTNTILTAIMSLFNQLAPYLSIYNFFQAGFKMILCLLEILCAFPNPFKMFSAMRKLFKQCLPNFLSLFPFLALLSMILAVLLLIVALIEYIITMVEALIKDLLANIETLANGLSLQDDDAVSATARKIAQLLCLMENLFAVLVAVGAVISIIQALANISGSSACGGGGAPSADSDSCCSDDVCPPFIHDNNGVISGTFGELIYYHRIDTDIGNMFHDLSPQQLASFNLPAVRGESWQFINQATGQPYPFKDIITTFGDGDEFWPEGTVFNKNTKSTKAPYTLDLTLKEYNPKVFIASEDGRSRDFIIKDVIITEKPYIGVIDFDNNLNRNINTEGTFNLAGGLVYEIAPNLDQNPYFVNGTQATIETFIHHNPIEGFLPTIDDGYYVGDINFNLNIHEEVLIGYGLITLGCSSDLTVERIIANTKIESVGFDAISVKLPNVNPTGPFPDVLGAQTCTANAIAKLRNSVSPASVAIFQAEITACLDQLKSETLESYCNILKAAVSIYESTVSNNVDVEFITRKIKTSVQLFDPSGTLISLNIPTTCVPLMESLLIGNVTLGSISNFTYDGYSTFNAEIESKVSGDGVLSVMFNNNIFKKILGSNDNTIQSQLKDNTLNYTFINTNVISKLPGVAGYADEPRRDESDASNDGGS
jgi:hypothetical protein